MDENRIAGTARELGGKVQRPWQRHRRRGDGGRGRLQSGSRAAQDMYGKTRDTAADAASNFESALRSTIETKPYTSVAVALALGWLLGRMHRPL